MNWISEYFDFFATLSFSQPHWGMELIAHLFWPVFCNSVLINVVVWLREALAEVHEPPKIGASTNSDQLEFPDPWLTEEGLLRPMNPNTGLPLLEGGLDMLGYSDGVED